MRAHQRALDTFFRKTGRDFQRFNYLGEWHSHPHFPVIPSGSDVRAMQAIVNDRGVGATFAALLIIRLRSDNTLEIGPYLFLPGKRVAYPIECVVVGNEPSLNTAPISSPEDALADQPPPEATIAGLEDIDDCDR